MFLEFCQCGGTDMYHRGLVCSASPTHVFKFEGGVATPFQTGRARTIKGGSCERLCPPPEPHYSLTC